MYRGTHVTWKLIKYKLIKTPNIKTLIRVRAMVIEDLFAIIY
jgi:hypothetical protein